MKKIILLMLGFGLGFLVAYFYFCNQNNLDIMSTPKGIITPAEASVLDKNFDSRHTLISNDIVKRPDNRSSWWSLADLEGFIQHAKDQAANDLKYDLNGFRMYMGAHPDTGGNVGYTTTFIVPTGNPIPPKGSSGLAAAGHGDIPGADGLNDSENGNPPSASYPQ